MAETTRLQSVVRALSARRRRSVAVALLVSAILAASLAFVLYAATSLTFVASEPTADRRFGAQNACALKALSGPRAGFAVSPSGRVAVYSAGEVALCAAGATPSATTLTLEGVSGVAFDGGDALWAFNAQGLFRLPRGGGHFERVGAITPRAIAGLSDGVVVFDAAGTLYSVGGDGQLRGEASLPGRAPSRADLSSDGALVAVTAGGGFFVFDGVTLRALRAEAPCEVQSSWWLPGGRLLLGCSGERAWSLTVNPRTGEQLEGKRAPPRKSTFVPGLNVYVEDCGQLPCSTSAPLG